MASASFASETYAGAHPAVLDAVLDASRRGHLAPYGDDPLTAALQARVEELFGAGTAMLLTFNGTAANVLGLGAVLAPHEAVVCPETAHLHQDECGAFERVLGRKLITVATPDGKLTPALLERQLQRAGQTRAVQPRVVSVTQCTELGTCYGVEELRALADAAHAHDLLVHVDGARLANAAVFLGTDLRGASRDCGADVVSLGCTKNGGLGADVMLVCSPGLVQELRFLQKQLMQVAAKTRFLAAQALALLGEELWRANAEHANAMAARLAAQLADVPGVRITRPVEANSVFAAIDAAACARLRERFSFYVWDEAIGEVRWTCSWDTDPASVDALAAAVRREHGTT
jgi:threonine aldolase